MVNPTKSSMNTKFIFISGRLTITRGTDIISVNSDTATVNQLALKIDEMSWTELQDLLLPKEEVIEDKVRSVQDLTIEEVQSSIENSTDPRFFVKDQQLFRVGITIPIPKELAFEIKAALDSNNAKEVDKLDNFWAWCSLMKNAKVRESFYKFCKKNKVRITDQGFIIGFRRAKSEDVPCLVSTELDTFVSENYARLRKNKKSTNITVYSVPEKGYTLNEVGTPVGILKELFLNINSVEETETAYYSSGTSKKTGLPMVYKVGVESALAEEDVDWDPNQECSAGIHAHMGRYSDSSYGDTLLACVINPMYVASCPYTDATKFRVQKLTPVATIKSIAEFDELELTEEISEMCNTLFAKEVAEMAQLLEDKEFEADSDAYTKLLSSEQKKAVLLQLIDNQKSLVKTRLIKV